MFKGPLDFTPLTIDVGHAWTPASYIPLKPTHKNAGGADSGTTRAAGSFCGDSTLTLPLNKRTRLGVLELCHPTSRISLGCPATGHIVYIAHDECSSYFGFGSSGR